MVAFHGRFSGIQTWPIGESQPRRDAVEVEAMMLFRIQQLRIVEFWEVFDERQIGRFASASFLFRERVVPRDSLNNSHEPRFESKSVAGRRSPEGHSHSMPEGCNTAATDLGRNPPGRHLHVLLRRGPASCVGRLAQSAYYDPRRPPCWRTHFFGKTWRCRRGRGNCSVSP